MGSDYDHKSEARAAMRKAAFATELDRLQWLRVALAWQDLGRGTEPAATAPKPRARSAE
jgi:hypothetical protein